MKNPDITQKQKREIFENDRKVSTYFHQAQSDAELNLGGRFKALHPITVTGANPAVAVPRQPADSPSNQLAMMPDEPLIDGTGEGLTLGYAIDRPDAPPAEPNEAGLRRRGWRRL
jgi:hypothetical protein